MTRYGPRNAGYYDDGVGMAMTAGEIILPVDEPPQDTGLVYPDGRPIFKHFYRHPVGFRINRDDR